PRRRFPARRAVALRLLPAFRVGPRIDRRGDRARPDLHAADEDGPGLDREARRGEVGEDLPRRADLHALDRDNLPLDGPPHDQLPRADLRGDMSGLPDLDPPGRREPDDSVVGVDADVLDVHPLAAVAADDADRLRVGLDRPLAVRADVRAP